MTSEWEDLEKLSKDELIIELVRQGWLYKDLKLHLRCPRRKDEAPALQ